MYQTETVQPDTVVNQAVFSRINSEYACPCDESTMYDTFVIPEKGEGMWVYVQGDEEPYLDLVMGFSALNFGHNHPEIKKFVVEGTERISHIHSFHTGMQLELSQYLSERLAPGESFKVYFDVGGSNVVGSALRLCRAYTGKDKIIAFTGGFHGTGFGPAAVSDQRFLTPDQYGTNPLINDVIRLPYPNPHHGIEVDTCIARLEAALKDEDPGAVLVEPIQGAAGFIIGGEKFIRAVRELTLKYGALMIDDEIQVGMGRAGRLYSIHNWGVIPDIALLSKSLAGGFYPLSAVIARSELFDSVPVQGTAFQSTFNNNPFGTYIAMRTLEMADRDNLFHNANVAGEMLLDKLRFLDEIPWIDNLHGVGLSIAFEIVTDKESKNPDPEKAKEFVEAMFKEHILVYAAGVTRNIIKLAPPLTINSKEIDTIHYRLKNCVHKI